MSSLLVFAAIVLVFVVLMMIGRANDMAIDMEGGFKDTSESSKRNSYWLMGFLILFLLGAAYSLKVLGPLMLPKAASIHGEKTDFLFDLTMVIIGVVFVITQIALFWFAFRYNESKNKSAYFYPHNNKLEVIWTAIPAFVMAILVIFGMKVWLEIFDTSKQDQKNMMVIEATGKQFNWIIRYPGKDGKLGDRLITKENISPTNELGINWADESSHDDFFPEKIYLVKNKPVLLKLGALDVLHSFYLPHFRVKMDCVPGVPTSFYFTPTMTTKEMQEHLSTKEYWQGENKEGQPKWKNFKYELACTEMCGRSHFGMQREVVVVEQAEYDKWLSEQKPMYASLAPAKTETASVAPVAASKFEKTLSTGFALAGASSSGIESKLISFIEDPSKVVDKTTWFSFDRLLFETGKSTLKPESQEQLKNMAEILKAFPQVELKVGGYTDNVGNPASNLKLSDERAKNVVAELGKLGVDVKRLEGEGYGDQHPVASNDTEEGRAQNRRIDVRVTKK